MNFMDSDHNIICNFNNTFPVRLKNPWADKQCQEVVFETLSFNSLWSKITLEKTTNYGRPMKPCLTFSRLSVKFLELSKKFQGRSLKIQPQTSFDLNGLKNGPSKHFESSLKSMHLFQRLMDAMNCKKNQQKNQSIQIPNIFWGLEFGPNRIKGISHRVSVVRGLK